MKRTVVKMVCNGEYRVVFNDVTNEYTITRVWHDERGKHACAMVNVPDLPWALTELRNVAMMANIRRT